MLDMLNLYLIDPEQETPENQQDEKLSPVAGFHPMAIQDLAQKGILESRYSVMTKWRWDTEEIQELFDKTKGSDDPWATMLHHMTTAAKDAKMEIVAFMGAPDLS